MFKPILSLLSGLILFSTILLAEKISVEADRFESEAGKFVYIGNVLLKTDKGKKLYCDRLIVITTPQGGIKKITAEGHIRYSDGKYEAVGNRAVYLPQKREIILEGNALVKTQKGLVKGDRVIYNLKTGSVKAEATQRVKTVFQIEENKK